MTVNGEPLDYETIPFSIESRLLRELGERLVKQPDVAVVELVKNSYDADATTCTIALDEYASLAVVDDGCGMTLEQFRDGWMRIGTSSKEATPMSARFARRITGEKGIGRFAVRFLGHSLTSNPWLSIPPSQPETRLVADFDWPSFDEHQDLGDIRVPYRVTRIGDETLRARASSSTGCDRKPTSWTCGGCGLSQLASSLRSVLFPSQTAARWRGGSTTIDPGFRLLIQEGDDAPKKDVAATVLRLILLRAVLNLDGQKIDLKVYRPGKRGAYLSIVDKYENDIGNARADIRFFPRRKGVFASASIDGRRAYSWIAENSGVAVFDRDFRVQPYGAA